MERSILLNQAQNFNYRVKKNVLFYSFLLMNKLPSKIERSVSLIQAQNINYRG
jgi:hypothetical protein